MTSDPVLVVGASGQLGGETARRLLARGVRVRAFSRNAQKLAPLAALGAEVMPGDLLNRAAIGKACEGARQVFSTANNFVGKGPTSPLVTDVPAYRNLLEAARLASVSRLVHVTTPVAIPGSPVDYFRVKAQIDDLIQGSGVPYVLIKSAAFTDVWVGTLIEAATKNGTVPLFGGGRRPMTLISVRDVAEFAVRILERDDIIDEDIEIAGPSTISMSDVVPLLERRMGRALKRKPIPTAVLWIASRALRPFNELGARLVSLGLWSATTGHRTDAWRGAADRFGVAPETVEQFIERAVPARQ